MVTLELMVKDEKEEILGFQLGVFGENISKELNVYQFGFCYNCMENSEALQIGFGSRCYNSKTLQIGGSNLGFNSKGFQLGGINVSEEESDLRQVGVWNMSGDSEVSQIGLLNVSEDSPYSFQAGGVILGYNIKKGIQFGLICYAGGGGDITQIGLLYVKEGKGSWLKRIRPLGYRKIRKN